MKKKNKKEEKRRIVFVSSSLSLSYFSSSYRVDFELEGGKSPLLPCSQFKERSKKKKINKKKEKVSVKISSKSIRSRKNNTRTFLVLSC